MLLEQTNFHVQTILSSTFFFLPLSVHLYLLISNLYVHTSNNPIIRLSPTFNQQKSFSSYVRTYFRIEKRVSVRKILQINKLPSLLEKAQVVIIENVLVSLNICLIFHDSICFNEAYTQNENREFNSRWIVFRELKQAEVFFFP